MMNSTNNYLHDARVFASPRVPSLIPQSAQFYTSSPRPFAKTSLGFYSDQPPVYDNVSDDEDEDMESGSGSGSGTSSGSSTPPTDEGGDCQSQDQTAPICDNNQQTINNNNACAFQPVQTMMPPPAPGVQLPSFQQQFQHFQSAQPGLGMMQTQNTQPSLTNIPLDQHTLQQLMVNPELLRQLNEASSRLMATNVAAANGQMPPPMPPLFSQGGLRNNTVSTQAMPPPPPPPPGFFPFGYPFPTPNQTPVNTPLPNSASQTPAHTPSQSPVCGAPVRPVITRLFSAQPLSQPRPILPQPSMAPLPLVNHQRPVCSWQNCNNVGLLKIASPPHEQATSSNQRGNKMCIVCGDERAGLHYGVICCFACMDFFRRRVMNAANKPRNERRAYNDCYNKTRQCIVTKDTRNNCKYCRFQRCLDVGMRVDLVRVAASSHGAASSNESRRCQSALPPMI